MIASLVPAAVCTVTENLDAEPPPLLSEEERCLGGVVETRRREFAAGRACARRALERFGIHNYPLLVGPDRAPIWPASVVGSITHCQGFVGAAVARTGVIRGIGIDAERARPIHPHVVNLICSPREREWIGTAPPPEHTGWVTLLFSAKEAAFKCIAPQCGRAIGFQDLEVTPDPAECRFAVRLAGEPGGAPHGAHLEGRYATSQTHVFTAVVLTASVAA